VLLIYESVRSIASKSRSEVQFKLNSAIKLIADETDEFDILNNEKTEIQLDFTLLFKCIHSYETLKQIDHFKSEYAATRKRQKELLIPATLNLLDEDEANLSSLLESISEFAIIERATMRKTDNFRAPVGVDEL
jgi:hypothetical protein